MISPAPARDFMPALGSNAFWTWWPKRMVWLVSPVAFPFTAIGVIAFLSGMVRLAVGRQWVLAMLVCLPVLFTLLAAVALAYPFGGRMVVFLAPLVAWVVAVGLAWAMDLLPDRLKPLADVVSVSLLVAMTLYAPITEPMNDGGRHDLSATAPALRDEGSPVVIDEILDYHYAQFERRTQIDLQWVILKVIDDDWSTTRPVPESLREVQYPLRPGTARDRFRVVVPATVFLAGIDTSRHATVWSNATRIGMFWWMKSPPMVRWPCFLH